jgi:hypothetical protein
MDCRSEYESYKELISVVADEPVITPSASERESLNLALASVKLPQPVCPSEDRTAQGFLGFLLASIFAFIAIAGLLVTQKVSLNNLIASADPISVVKGFSTLGVVVFTTSFLPIVITARRRPLNGLTFRR